MLIDFNFSGKNILVVGGGAASYRKVLRFIDAQPKIQVVSKTFSEGMKKLQKMKKVDLVKAEVKDVEAFIKTLKPKPDLVIAATDNQDLNTELAVKAKSLGCMVYAIDNPQISDFTLPALAKICEVKVAISTAGKSPAMAGILRRRIEKMITEEDMLQIRLQCHVRELLKKKIPDQKVRRKILYKILKNGNVSRFLKEKKFGKALEEAVKIVEEHRICGNCLE